MTAPARDFQSDRTSAVVWRPGRLWSLWDIMRAFRASTLCNYYATLMQVSERASNEPAYNAVPPDWLERVRGSLSHLAAITHHLLLEESKDCILRLLKEFEESSTYDKLRFKLEELLQLMESEAGKRKTFMLDPDRAKYYLPDEYGVIRDHPLNALIIHKPRPILISEKAETAFPSAYMDIVEAGRCLALNRNNAAAYHLMQAAEIGLRILAWDRRVIVKRGKSRTLIPLDFAQWGEILAELEEKQKKIDNWKRGKALREEAKQFYRVAVFEVSSFNEIYRKHLSHARATLYQPETAINCWAHVCRFLDGLSERMSEQHRTPTVWRAKK
jgi:hypothetical protein